MSGPHARPGVTVPAGVQSLQAFPASGPSKQTVECGNGGDGVPHWQHVGPTTRVGPQVPVVPSQVPDDSVPFRSGHLTVASAAAASKHTANVPPRMPEQQSVAPGGAVVVVVEVVVVMVVEVVVVTTSAGAQINFATFGVTERVPNWSTTPSGVSDPGGHRTL